MIIIFYEEIELKKMEGKNNKGESNVNYKEKCQGYVSFNPNPHCLVFKKPLL
jgi:hypothetical protein